MADSSPVVEWVHFAHLTLPNKEDYVEPGVYVVLKETTEPLGLVVEVRDCEARVLWSDQPTQVHWAKASQWRMVWDIQEEVDREIIEDLITAEKGNT